MTPNIELPQTRVRANRRALALKLDSFIANRGISKLSLVAAMTFWGLAASCPGPTTAPTPPPNTWLVFLCRASDALQEPQGAAFYEELFDNGHRDLLFDYFQAASDRRIDLAATEVQGWFPMTVTQADVAPAVRNNSTPVTRSQTAQDCRTAGVTALLAQGRRINPDDYRGFIAVINVPVDAGAAGMKSIVANHNETPSFYAHEMLHIYGLDHSYTMAADSSADHAWETGSERVYFDCWDIMSFATCTYRFNVAPYGLQGPELQIAYREKLGWVAKERIFVKAGSEAAPSTVKLAPVSEPDKDGVLLAKVEVPGSDGYYGVEYRTQTRFDRGIPRAAVVIRERRRDGKTYLITRQNGGIAWNQGEQFRDSGNFISITVDSLSADSASVTIDPRFDGGTAMLGEKCGDKYRGAVRSCAAAAVCAPRHNPPLVSIDYFCQ